MIRDLLGSIDTGILAQVGLLAFMVAFLSVVAYAFTMKKSAREAAKRMPLDDNEEIVFHRN